jgi:hypothetical protein
MRCKSINAAKLDLVTPSSDKTTQGCNASLHGRVGVSLNRELTVFHRFDHSYKEFLKHNHAKPVVFEKCHMVELLVVPIPQFDSGHDLVKVDLEKFKKSFSKSSLLSEITIYKHTAKLVDSSVTLKKRLV